MLTWSRWNLQFKVALDDFAVVVEHTELVQFQSELNNIQ